MILQQFSCSSKKKYSKTKPFGSSKFIKKHSFSSMNSSFPIINLKKSASKYWVFAGALYKAYGSRLKIFFSVFTKNLASIHSSIHCKNSNLKFWPPTLCLAFFSKGLKTVIEKYWKALSDACDFLSTFY